MQHAVFHTFAFLAFSCLAFSTLAFWCRIFMSRNFMSRIFSVPVGSRNFQLPLWVASCSVRGSPVPQWRQLLRDRERLLCYISLPVHMMFPRFPVPPFPPLETWSRVFQSCDFHPCDLVPRFPVLTFPVPRFQSPRSIAKVDFTTFLKGDCVLS